MKNLKEKGYIFIFFSLCLMILMFAFSFYVKNISRQREGKKTWTLTEFLNDGDKVGIKNVAIGLIYGFIIGVMDILGIWYVLKYLKVFMPKGANVEAGLAEVYSSFMAVVLGTFISHSIKTWFPLDKKIPIWTEPVGVLLGSFITLFYKMQK